MAINANALFSKEQIGQKAEERFQDWMNVHGIVYYRIDQEPFTLALALRGIARRPDFQITIGSIGAKILCDVKSRHYDVVYENFIIDEEDIQRLDASQKCLNQPV